MLFPIAPKAIPGRDTHAFIDGLFTKEEINKILALPQWFNLENGTIGTNNGVSFENEKIRSSQVSWIYPNEQTAFIWEKIAFAVADINSKFFQFNLTGCFEPIQLGLYKANENGHYNWHTDASMMDTQFPRKLSMSLTLSDPSEYEGGELQLKTESDDPITVQTPQGRAWFFPSYTLHRVAPVTKGIRRSLVIWVGGPAFK